MASFDERLKDFLQHQNIHTNSFNYAMENGLKYAIQNIPPTEFAFNGRPVSISIQDVSISRPEFSVADSTEPLFPTECRLCGLTYSSNITLSLLWEYNGKQYISKFTKQIPVMVKSVLCNLYNLTAEELKQRKEEKTEAGGYFIVNGKERIFRHFLTMRRNYPFGIIDPYWKKKGQYELYTEFGVKMKCVRLDETISHTVLRYCESGMVEVMFEYEGYYKYVPLGLLLKALVNKTDQFIFNSLVHDHDDMFYKESILRMLRALQDKKIYSQEAAIISLGQHCSKSFFQVSDPKDIVKLILRRGILIHIQENVDKFNLLCYMTRKLFSLVRKKCTTDDKDNLMNKEVLLSGQLYLMLLKYELGLSLQSAGKLARQMMRRLAYFDFAYIVDYSTQRAVWSSHIDNSLSTGNIPDKLGLVKTTGYSLFCERVNMMRFKSYFSAIEKFSFTSHGLASRRYLEAEAFGFLCPVHTPDGTETGLKNHLAAGAMITTSQVAKTNLIEALAPLGLENISSDHMTTDICEVLVDGQIVGGIQYKEAENFVTSVRLKRNAENSKISPYTEIVFISRSGYSLYPGIFIFTSPGRLVRVVKNLATSKEECIGSFEQTFLHICMSGKEKIKKVTTHQEIQKQCMLSGLAGTIPFCESNQSPKNILACQMAKQAIGIASHSPQFRADSTLHQLTHPQHPMITTPMYKASQLEEFPCGINAIIAVISYSGFDLEDAIVLNKASVERGLFHCQILKTELIDLEVQAKNLNLEPDNHLRFERGNHCNIEEKLDADGLPYIGQKLEFGDPMCSYTESNTGINHLYEYKSENVAHVQNIKIFQNHKGIDNSTSALIQLSIIRSVEVGDKFSSRHGQKGVCGLKMAAVDMPFSANGIIPDILFNPHGFPSRMTIGMMIELMAGKVAVLEGNEHMIEPFIFSDKNMAVDYYCKRLVEAGYNPYGTEKFISGVSGQELEAEVFTGIVYYQRLTHMVADKYQVRCVGKVDEATQQPVKGFPRDGAVKFGEMERDSLLSHGASFLLQDRFLECSDKCWVCICKNCKKIFCPFLTKKVPSGRKIMECQICGEKAKMEIAVPHVFMYFIAELSFLNIKITVG